MNRLISVILLLMLAIACQPDYQWTNPLDPDSELDSLAWSPYMLQAEAISDQDVALTWRREDERIEKFHVYRTLTAEEDYKLIAEVVSRDSIVTFSDSLVPVGYYRYRVSSYNGKRNSAFSNTVPVAVVFNPSVSVNCTLLSEKVVRINWQIMGADSGKYHYDHVIVKRINSQTRTEETIADSVSSGKNFVVDSMAVFGQTYIYDIYLANSVNISSKCSSKPIKLEFPSPSNVLGEVISEHSIALTWTGNCDFAVGYKMYRRPLTQSGMKLLGEVTSTGELTFVDDNAEYGIEYYYEVRAFTQTGESGGAGTNVKIKMADPGILTVRRDLDHPDTHLLTWTESGNSYRTGTYIYRDTGAGEQKIADVGADQKSYEDANINPETAQYRYRIVEHTESHFTGFSNMDFVQYRMTDVDGNIYPCTKIGDRHYMNENLRVTHLRNGDALRLITDPEQWCSDTLAISYCYYDNDSLQYSNSPVGALYSWNSVSDSRKLAPPGWHIMTLSDFLYLENFTTSNINMINQWSFSGTMDMDKIGFAPVAGGFRFGGSGWFSGMGTMYLWTNSSVIISINSYSSLSTSWSQYKSGYSVRCVTD